MKVEICNNREFIRENILTIEADDVLREEAAERWAVEAHEILHNAGFDVTNPRGQRQTYHGWNGAQGWRAHGRGWGTFDPCSKIEEDCIDMLLGTLTNEINAEYNAAAKEISE